MNTHCYCLEDNLNSITRPIFYSLSTFIIVCYVLSRDEEMEKERNLFLVSPSLNPSVSHGYLSQSLGIWEGIWTCVEKMYLLWNDLKLHLTNSTTDLCSNIWNKDKRNKIQNCSYANLNQVQNLLHIFSLINCFKILYTRSFQSFLA